MSVAHQTAEAPELLLELPEAVELEAAEANGPEVAQVAAEAIGERRPCSEPMQAETRHAGCAHLHRHPSAVVVAAGENQVPPQTWPSYKAEAKREVSAIAIARFPPHIKKTAKHIDFTSCCCKAAPGPE